MYIHIRSRAVCLRSLRARSPKDDVSCVFNQGERPRRTFFSSSDERERERASNRHLGKRKEGRKSELFLLSSCDVAVLPRSPVAPGGLRHARRRGER